MNNDFSDVTLMTVSSQSVIMPFILFGIKVKAVYLCKLYELQDEAKKRYNGYIENYFVKKNPEFMFMPATVEEMVHF